MSENKEISKIYSLEVEGHNLDSYNSLKDMLSVLLMNFITAPMRQMELVRIFVILDSHIQVKILLHSLVISGVLVLSTIVGILTGDNMLMSFIITLVVFVIILILFLVFKLREYSDEEEVSISDEAILKKDSVTETPVEIKDTSKKVIVKEEDDLEVPLESEVGIKDKETTSSLGEDLFGVKFSEEDLEQVQNLKEKKLELSEVREQYGIDLEIGDDISEENY